MLKQWGDHLVQLGTPSTLSEGSAAPGHGMRFSEYVRLMDWCAWLHCKTLVVHSFWI
jgi:hypothetical protein